MPWNFTKFLVDRKTEKVYYFNPRVSQKDIIKEIKKMIKDNTAKEEAFWKAWHNMIDDDLTWINLRTYWWRLGFKSKELELNILNVAQITPT